MEWNAVACRVMSTLPVQLSGPLLSLPFLRALHPSLHRQVSTLPSAFASAFCSFWKVLSAVLHESQAYRRFCSNVTSPEKPFVEATHRLEQW